MGAIETRFRAWLPCELFVALQREAETDCRRRSIRTEIWDTHCGLLLVLHIPKAALVQELNWQPFGIGIVGERQALFLRSWIDDQIGAAQDLGRADLSRREIAALNLPDDIEHRMRLATRAYCAAIGHQSPAGVAIVMSRIGAANVVVVAVPRNAESANDLALTTLHHPARIVGPYITFGPLIACIVQVDRHQRTPRNGKRVAATLRCL